MMALEHTPGPWHVEDGALVKEIEDGPTGWFVCHLKTECDGTALCRVENKSDAHLIAAAPALLEALIAARTLATVCMVSRCYSHEELTDIARATRSTFEAAIAQARGHTGEKNS